MKSVVPPHGFKRVPELEAWLEQAKKRHAERQAEELKNEPGVYGHRALVDHVEEIAPEHVGLVDSARVQIEARSHRHLCGKQISCQCGAVLDARSAWSFCHWEYSQIKSYRAACPGCAPAVLRRLKNLFVSDPALAPYYRKGSQWVEVVDGARLAKIAERLE